METQLEKAGKEKQKYQAFQEIAQKAQSEGHNAIKFKSKRADGNNYVIFGDNNKFFKEALKPQIVTPATK